MPVKFENYTHSFRLNGKPVFAPSDLGRRIGEDVKQRIENAHLFPDYYFHLRNGGHVAALHSHRESTHFCKIDIENFFYSVARNRVVRALREISIPRPAHYGKWSCVQNPYGYPSYALPYGFVQSTILATLVLSTSEVGRALQRMNADTNVAVYVDDISLSSNDPVQLTARYHELLDAIDHAGLTANTGKCVSPCRDLTVFNCSLRNGETAVTPNRVSEFHATLQSPASLAGFEHYCQSVERGNC